MTTLRKILLAMLVITLLCCSAAYAYPGESIMLDPVSGDYTITYWNESMEPPALEITTFVPSTKINPTLHSSLRMERDAKIIYRYTLTNGKQSRQYISLMILDPVSEITGVKDGRYINTSTQAGWDASVAVMISNEAALSTPAGWSGSVSFGAMGRKDNTVRVGWSNSSGLLQPGGNMRGFGFVSTALPGIIMAALKGRAPVHGWSGEGPTDESAIDPQLRQIMRNNFVPHPVAVPAITVPSPFNAATLLESIQIQMHTWIGMQLLDATFSSQLDRYLTAAANAYRLNQPKAGKEHIQTLRKMLKKEHEDSDKDDEKEDGKHEGKHDNKSKRIPIDRLAARVLDFDLKYVLKRMGGED